MSASVRGAEHVDTFFQSIEPTAAAYNDVTFSYLAVRVGDAFQLVQGRLRLITGATRTERLYFDSKNVRAGVHSIAELGIDVRQFVDFVIAGTIQTPNGPLLFPPNDTSWLAVNHDPLHPDGERIQQRIRALTILGGRTELYLPNKVLDWDLRAAIPPYESLQEVANVFGLGPLRDIRTVEVIAFCVALVDATSTVAGTTATLRLRLGNQLPVDLATLGYRLLSNGIVVGRHSISGTGMEWAVVDGIRVGSATVEVPKAAILHCVATYRGIAESSYWVGDPSLAQNPRRAVYELTDNRLEILQDLLFNSQARNRNARELERGIAWLLWMNGFSVLHLGSASRTQEGPDLIAVTPRGNVAVIECTTGLLRAENKLARLIDRSNNIRRRLDDANHRHLRLLSVMITSRTRIDIEAEIESAERLRALVVTREDLEQTVQRTSVMSDPDMVFEQAERTVQDAAAKYEFPAQSNPQAALSGRQA